jgi:hypothetical protein
MNKWLEKFLRAPEGEGGGGDGGGTEVETILGGDQQVETKADEVKTEETKTEVKADEVKTEAKADEVKTEEKKEQTPEEKAAAEAAAKLDKVPGEGELYEFALPEGMELDSTLAEKAQPVLKELGLTTGQANKLASLLAETRAAEADAIVENYVTIQKGFVAAAKADEEIGGQNWDVSVKEANQALQKFGTPALTAALREHGLANHPEMIRFCKRIGSHTADDTLDKGDHVDTTEVPPEARWYGDTTATTKKRG